MTRFVRTVRVMACAALVACAGGPKQPAVAPADAAPLHDAMHQLSTVMVYDILSPPQAGRVYSYASIAAYEVLRQAAPGYRSLAGQVKGLTAIPQRDTTEAMSLSLAGVHAFMTVGRALTFSQARMDTLRAALDERYRGGLSSREFERSVAYGDTVAAHILAWAATDRFKQSRGLPKYSVTNTPGRWVPTPPAYMDAVEPNWGTIRGFVLDTSTQFRPAPPLPFDSVPGSAFYAQMKEVREIGANLTEAQRAIAAFWDCNPYVMNVQGHTMFATKKISPGGHWMAIVGLVSRKANADITRSAEAYARTAMAISDGFLSVWAEKYASAVIRPETMINKYLDEKWVPLLQTPPFPEYTSGHSGISSAAAVVLTRLYGENFAFTDSSEVEFGLPIRSFTSFTQAADEASISRLYGGIHYRRAIEEGQVQGRKVGALHLSAVTTGPQTTVTATR